MISMGLTIVLSKASTMATINADQGDEITTPGRIYPTTRIDMVLIIIRVSMIVNFKMTLQNFNKDRSNLVIYWEKNANFGDS